MAYTSLVIALRSTGRVPPMTDWLIAAVLFVAIITTLAYLWKRERS
jgi:hypothetical protein